MKKFSALIYILVMLALVLPMSGCGGGGGGSSSTSNNESNNNNSNNNNGGNDQNPSQASNLMVITSSLLKKDGSYKLFRGDKVKATFPNANANPMYYAAPIAGSENVTLNLEFANALGDDQPFMITTEDNDANVVFYYNPKGTGTDTATAYGSVLRNGGGTQQLSYNGLNVSSSSAMAAIINDFLGEEIVLNLDSETNTVTVDGASAPFFNYVWHADPDHKDEYYTLGLDVTEEITESEMMANITAVKGVYINRDIRYMPNTINFTATVKDDEETEYAAYYSEEVRAEVAAELGEGYEGPFIFATLPNSAGQGGPGGDRGPGNGPTPPNRNAVQGAISNSDIAAFSTMTHSPEDAYENPVLHITETGLYRLKGTWHGQIAVDVDDESQIVLLLDNVTASCDVAPALVFYNAFECGPTDSDTVSANWKTLGSELAENAGAVVVLANGSVNNFTGANVYRMLKPEPKKSATAINGTDVSQQKKRYKMDAAFYSFVSMVIGAESDTNPGTLNITSTTYEGLDTEMHLTIDSGIVNVTAEDDGINVNEDDVSVFTLDGGELTIVAKNGDGIDSNGYITLNKGKLDITAARDSNEDNAEAEGPMDADCDVYRSDDVTYTHRAYSGDSGNQPGEPGDNPGENPSPDNGGDTSSKTPIEVTDSNGSVVMSIKYSNPAADTDTTDRGIAESGSVFTLTHKVNNFSGVK